MNVIDAIRHHSRVRPYDIAVIHPSGSATYLQLAAVVTNLALRLRTDGIERGHTVAIYATEPFVHLALALALALNGSISVSAHPNYDPMPEGARIDAYLVDRNLSFEVEGQVVPVGANWISDAQREGEPLLVRTGVDDPQGYARLYTSSGTTGIPKLIGHTRAGGEDLTVRGIALDPINRGPNLCMMWLSTIGGFGMAHASLWQGVTLVLAFAPAQVLRFISLYRVVSVLTSPQQLQGLVELVRGRPVRFPSLERIAVGGSSPPAALMLAARAYLCSNVGGVYGSTEAGLIAQAPAAVMQAHPDAAGYVVPFVEVRIVDEAGRPLGTDVEGIIQVRSPYCAKEYIGDPVATAQAFKDGWFVPGDIGMLRADGLLHIRGRVDEMINAGGVKLSPVLVDDFLLSQPGVTDAAAFAYRRAGQHDQVWAAIVCAEDFNQQALLDAARAKLNSRAPVRFVRLPEIPRNAMGKPMRAALSERAASAL
jgi:acyl-coenzyme A synthetase/AMP-(fatty) acid ligase